MAVIVRLRLELLDGMAPSGQVLETPAVINTGYRAERRELSLPGEAARHLGIYPRLPNSASPLEVRGYGGKTSVWAITDILKVCVVADDREGPSVIASVLINPSDDEILVSDSLAGGLGLVLLDTEVGTWRFRDDPPDSGRASHSPRFW